MPQLKTFTAKIGDLPALSTATNVEGQASVARGVAQLGATVRGAALDTLTRIEQKRYRRHAGQYGYGPR